MNEDILVIKECMKILANESKLLVESLNLIAGVLQEQQEELGRIRVKLQLAEERSYSEEHEWDICGERLKQYL